MGRRFRQQNISDNIIENTSPMHANGKRQRPEVMRDIKWNKGDKGHEKGQKEHKQGTNVK